MNKNAKFEKKHQNNVEKKHQKKHEKKTSMIKKKVIFNEKNK